MVAGLASSDTIPALAVAGSQPPLDRPGSSSATATATHARTRPPSIPSCSTALPACLISSYRQHGWLTGGRTGVRRAPVRSQWSRRGAGRGLLRAVADAGGARSRCAGAWNHATRSHLAPPGIMPPEVRGRPACRRKKGSARVAVCLCVACPSVPLPACSGVERPGFLERIS